MEFFFFSLRKIANGNRKNLNENFLYKGFEYPMTALRIFFFGLLLSESSNSV